MILNFRLPIGDKESAALNKQSEKSVERNLLKSDKT